MDPSLKVSLMNHCVICLKKVGDDGEGETKDKFEFADSPSLLATFNEFWRILKGQPNNGSSGVSGISLTTAMKAQGQGAGGNCGSSSMNYFSEPPTLCTLCGGKAINVYALLKAVRQQVREAQLLWSGCRKKEGRRFKEFENHLQGNGLGKGEIRSALQFLGISAQDQSQPNQNKDNSDKLRQVAVVRLERLQIKQEPPEEKIIQDEELPLQLTAVAGFCEQPMEFDEDSRNLLDNDCNDQEDEPKPKYRYLERDPLCLDEQPLDKELERKKRKAERDKQRRAALKEGGPLTADEQKKREEAKRKKAESDRRRRAAFKERVLLSAEAKKKWEEIKKKKAEMEKVRRARLKEQSEKARRLTPEQLLERNQERKRKEAERKKEYRARMKKTGPLSEEEENKDEEEKSEDVERKRVRRAAAAQKEKVTSADEEEEEENDIGDSDSDWGGMDDGQDDDSNYSGSEVEDNDDQDKPVDKLKEEEDKEEGEKKIKRGRGRRKGEGKGRKPSTEEVRRRNNEMARFRRLEKKVKMQLGPLTPQQIEEQHQLREKFRRARQPVKYDEDGKPVYTEKQLERRRRERERVKRFMQRKKEKERAQGLTPEQLEKREEQKRINAEKARFRRIEKQLLGFTSEEIRKHDEYNARRKETQRIQREKLRAGRGPVPRKIDRRTLAKMAVADVEPLEILVSLRQPVGQQKKMNLN